ncbi:MAG: hypothetical protein A3H98_10950 [Bacteroidetes bacterium RIFCSPLOWO2_02_FULL_36_8]|nr:MAG: hypothetical protein A3H98_10950 [Bacteroidetes bacterium RIFCSPLOWO2_02_FULL_36_8]OFY71253.1 MAG: hypothetical protein A3G23_01910 [Bacteroidetes bacterium RIFCSPLOWO2_12_FULL_37_12]
MLLVSKYYLFSHLKGNESFIFFVQKTIFYVKKNTITSNFFHCNILHFLVFLKPVLVFFTIIKLKIMKLIIHRLPAKPLVFIGKTLIMKAPVPLLQSVNIVSGNFFLFRTGYLIH